MLAYPLMKLCEKIRERAKTQSLNVLRETKNDEWKTQLLNLISDDVVLKQLMFVHPFQFAEELSSPAWYVFRLPFFKYSIYVKIDENISKLISFHYDELPKEPRSLNELFIAPFAAQRVQIIESGTGADRYLPIVLGSSIIKLYPNKVYRDADNTAYVDSEYLKAAINDTRLIQTQILDKLTDIVPYDIDFLNISGKDVNLLTWIDENKALQTVSLLSDVYNKNPQINWLRDICVDILLANTTLKDTLQIYNSQLYPHLPKLSAECNTQLDELEK